MHLNMKQLNEYADDRLIHDCIYCGAIADTRDHVPSKILLDKPYPENLPVVGACRNCNSGFSKDEQYLVCFVESALAGLTDPDKIKTESVARAMRRAPALRARIEKAKTSIDGGTYFRAEEGRLKNVALKLARGHAAFELSQPCKSEPDHYWCGPLSILPEEKQDEFNAVHIQQVFGEIGSRNIQRMYAMNATVTQPDGSGHEIQAIVNDWVEVQEGRYRFLAIDDTGGIVIRIVIYECLACEVAWSTDT